MRLTEPVATVDATSRHFLRPSHDVRWGTREAAAAYLIGTVLSSVLFAAAGGTGDNTTVWMHLAGLIGLWSALIAGVVFSARVLGSGSVVDDFRLRVSLADVPVGLAVGAGLQLIAVPLVSWPIERYSNADIEAPARALVDTAGPKWLLFALIIVGAPFVEELFFRGLLLGGLARRLDDWPAMAICSALFAATHFQLAQFPGLFVVAFSFALLARKARRLGPAIIAHLAFNAAGVWLVT